MTTMTTMTTTGKRVRQAHILVPLTLGGATPPQLAAVTAQALAQDARVTLLHVLDGAAPSENAENVENAAQAAVEAEPTKVLNRVAARLRRAGVGTKARVGYSSVPTIVCDVAREQGAALILVGASEPNGLCGRARFQAQSTLIRFRFAEPGSHRGARPRSCCTCAGSASCRPAWPARPNVYLDTSTVDRYYLLGRARGRSSSMTTIAARAPSAVDRRATFRQRASGLAGTAISEKRPDGGLVSPPSRQCLCLRLRRLV